jgi:hypothetical protein
MDKVKCMRIYADAQGESHWGEVEVELKPTNYAPPAPPLHVSASTPATRYVLASAPMGWFGDWHPSPCRQLAVYVSGIIEVQASDGETRQLRAGDILLVDDTTGKGHRGRSVGDEDVLVVFAHLPD